MSLIDDERGRTQYENPARQREELQTDCRRTRAQQRETQAPCLHHQPWQEGELQSPDDYYEKLQGEAWFLRGSLHWDRRPSPKGRSPSQDRRGDKRSSNARSSHRTLLRTAERQLERRSFLSLLVGRSKEERAKAKKAVPVSIREDACRFGEGKAKEQSRRKALNKRVKDSQRPSSVRPAGYCAWTPGQTFGALFATLGEPRGCLGRGGAPLPSSLAFRLLTSRSGGCVERKSTSSALLCSRIRQPQVPSTTISMQPRVWLLEGCRLQRGLERRRRLQFASRSCEASIQ